MNLNEALLTHVGVLGRVNIPFFCGDEPSISLPWLASDPIDLAGLGGGGGI